MMVLVAAASWGTWSLFLRPLDLPATVTGTVVFAVMGLVTLPWCIPSLFASTNSITWTKRIILLLLGNGILDALNVLTYFSAIEHTSAAIAVLTHYLAPCIIALLAPTIDKRKQPGAITAAIVALLGLLLVLAPWQPTDSAVSSGSVNASSIFGVGTLFGLLSAVCYAGNVFVVRRLASEIGAARAISYHAFIAAAILLPFAAPHLHQLSGHAAIILSIAAVTIGAGSGVLFVGGLRYIDSGQAAVLTYAEPLVAVLIGAIWYHEPFGVLAIAGATLIAAAGIYVATRRKP
jgi:drug/metabolite transporter, DME family